MLYAVVIAYILADGDYYRQDLQNLLKLFRIIWMTKFFIVAIINFIAGIIFLYRTKIFNKLKYYEIRNKVLATIILTSVSFIARGLFIVLSTHYKFEDTLVIKSIEDNSWIFPIFVVLWYSIVDLLPI
jgi:hypothetical protein